MDEVSRIALVNFLEDMEVTNNDRARRRNGGLVVSYFRIGEEPDPHSIRSPRGRELVGGALCRCTSPPAERYFLKALDGRHCSAPMMEDEKEVIRISGWHIELRHCRYPTVAAHHALAKITKLFITALGRFLLLPT